MNHIDNNEVTKSFEDLCAIWDRPELNDLFATFFRIGYEKGLHLAKMEAYKQHRELIESIDKLSISR